MSDTIMMMFKLRWRNWRWLWTYDTCTHAAFHKALKDTTQERLMILISCCSKFTGVRVPKIIKLEL